MEHCEQHACTGLRLTLQTCSRLASQLPGGVVRDTAIMVDEPWSLGKPSMHPVVGTSLQHADRRRKMLPRRRKGGRTLNSVRRAALQKQHRCALRTPRAQKFHSCNPSGAGPVLKAPPASEWPVVSAEEALRFFTFPICFADMIACQPQTQRNDDDNAESRMSLSRNYGSVKDEGSDSDDATCTFPEYVPAQVSQGNRVARIVV
jgi:hypothetical protein